MQARKKSEADWALEIMAQRQEPLFYDDLVRSIAKEMGKRSDMATLSSIYTRINLDNRLIYQGEGYWFYDPNKIYREQ